MCLSLVWSGLYLPICRLTGCCRIHWHAEKALIRFANAQAYLGLLFPYSIRILYPHWTLHYGISYHSRTVVMKSQNMFNLAYWKILQAFKRALFFLLFPFFFVLLLFPTFFFSKNTLLSLLFSPTLFHVSGDQKLLFISLLAMLAQSL